MFKMLNIFNDIYQFFEHFFKEFMFTMLGNLLKIIIIITVILVALEILKALKVLDFLNRIFYTVTKPLGITQSATMPLLIGILAGLTYGAGAILASYANQEMTRKDVILVSVFLCCCHALPEDTLLFIAAGANGLLIAAIRFVLAVFSTLLVGFVLKQREKNIPKEDSSESA